MMRPRCVPPDLWARYTPEQRRARLLEALLVHGLRGGAGNECRPSIQFCRTRVARLGADGVPLPGANNLYVTDKAIRLAWSPQVTEGAKIRVENGCGEACVNFEADDVVDRYNLTLELCVPDAELTELLSGGTVLTQGGSTRGWQAPALGSVPAGYGVSIEGWSKALDGGVIAGTRPYWRWVFPRTKKWRLGDRELANSAMATVLTGIAEENANWYNGPANDWPLDSTKAYQYANIDSALPAAVCGYQTLSAS